MQVWILTFNRPKALQRQVDLWSNAGHSVHVYSNSPEVEEWGGLDGKIDSITYNSNGYKESSSYCARSWNHIFIKAFMNKPMDEGVVFVQDDTNCGPNTPKLIEDNYNNKDFIWGPAGDTFFFMKKEVLKRVGWFDERFLGCYCGDADFMLRATHAYKKPEYWNKITIEETHDWGWVANPIGITNNIRWDLPSKTIDADYQNQHWELEKTAGNPVLIHSQKHFREKWKFAGNGINGIGPLIAQPQPTILPYEIDWYPWWTQKELKGNE